MTSPTRGNRGGGELPDEARALLRQASRPVAPSAAERAAMAAMAARIAAVPVPLGASAPWSKLATLGGWKGLAVAGLISVAGASAWFAARSPLDEAGAGAAPSVVSTTAPAVTTPPSAAAAAGAAVTTASLVASATPAADSGSSALGADEHAVPAVALVDARSEPVSARQGTARAAVVGAATAPAGASAPLARASAPLARATTSSVHRAASTSPTAAAPPPACLADLTTPGDRAAEAPLLAAAARALASNPTLALACVQQLSQLGGPWQLSDEHLFLSFEASRRLARGDDARRWARALLASSPRSAYAARARAYLDDNPATSP